MPFRLAGAVINACISAQLSEMSGEPGWSRPEELEALLASPDDHVIFCTEEPSSETPRGCCGFDHPDRERCAHPADISLFLLISLLPASVTYAKLLVARIALHVVLDAVLWTAFVWPPGTSAKLPLLTPFALLLPLGGIMLCAEVSERPLIGLPLQWWLFVLFKLSSLVVSLIFLAKVYVAGNIIFELELLSAKLDACALLLLPLWLCRRQRHSFERLPGRLCCSASQSAV